MSLTPIFYTRANSYLTTPKSLSFTVDNFRWSAIGGPVDAQITAQSGEINDLWSLCDYLRCPVVIRDQYDNPCWWGYVFAVEIQSGGVRFGVSLDRMANRVSAKYQFIAVGSQEVGETKTTTIANDTDSQTEYGIKELQVSMSGASDAQALQVRDTTLARQKYPTPTVTFDSQGGDSSATLTCAGWFDTLGWEMYANAGTTAVATTTQIATIVTSVGQFITATDIDNASGVTSSEYRDGTQTGLDEILALLKTGTTNSRRLLATVGVDRRLRIYEEPARPTAAPYLLNSQGQICYPTGIPVEPHLAGSLACGNWAALSGVIPANVDLTHFADPSMQFIEEVVYSAPGQVTITPRDQPGWLELDL